MLKSNLRGSRLSPVDGGDDREFSVGRAIALSTLSGDKARWQMSVLVDKHVRTVIEQR